MNQQEATERFYRLVWPHRPTILRTAQFLTGDANEAEDIAQETLLKAFKSLASFREGTDMKAWLMTILRNTRIDHLRTASSSAANVSLDQLATEPADSRAGGISASDGMWQDAEDVFQEFSDQQVIEALLALPEDIRWTLLLVDVEQMDHKDAAVVLDIPVGTVKSRTHRGRSMLRQRLLPVAEEMKLIRKRDRCGGRPNEQ